MKNANDTSGAPSPAAQTGALDGTVTAGTEPRKAGLTAQNSGDGSPAVPRFNWDHILLAVLGLALSGYAVHLHNLVAAGAATGCGISETISCDKVIGSKPWGAPFGIPLGMFGLAYFGVVAVTAVNNPDLGWDAYRKAALVRLGLGTAGVLSSMALEFVMWVILRHGCPVCIATHLVTLVNFLFALVHWLRLRPRQPLPEATVPMG